MAIDREPCCDRRVAPNAGRRELAVGDARPRRGDRAARRADCRRRADGRRSRAAPIRRASSTVCAGRSRSRARSGSAAPRTLPRAVRAAIGAGGAAHSPRRAGAACRAGFARRSRAGVVRRAARHPARPRRLLRPRRAVSAALVAADDGDSGARRRAWARSSPSARGRIRPCWPRRSRPASIASSRSAARTRWRRSPTARARVPRVDKIVGPGNRWVAAAKALVSRDCAIDFYAGPTEILIVAAARAGRLDCRGSDRAGRARSGRARAC